MQVLFVILVMVIVNCNMFLQPLPSYQFLVPYRLEVKGDSHNSTIHVEHWHDLTCILGKSCSGFQQHTTHQRRPDIQGWTYRTANFFLVPSKSQQIHVFIVSTLVDDSFNGCSTFDINQSASNGVTSCTSTGVSCCPPCSTHGRD